MKNKKIFFILGTISLIGITSLAIFANNSSFLSGNLPKAMPFLKNLNINSNPSPVNNSGNISSPGVKIAGSCYQDNALKITTFTLSASLLGTLDQNVVKLPQITNSTDCEATIAVNGYRFAEYYKTTPEFALVCTKSCSIKDIDFLNAMFDGEIKGVAALKEAVGYLPKTKLEFHPGQDGDCFKVADGGYGDHPTGYTWSLANGNAIVCTSEYYGYLDSQQYPWKRDLNYERSIESQILTLHEPIHQIFWQYNNTNSDAPWYNIQESFCKGISLIKTETLDKGKPIQSYGDSWFADQFTIDNPPTPNNGGHVENFLVYSLNKRFGFDIGPQTKQFFDLYKNDQTVYANGNERVKALLDKVLKQNTKKSFDDIGISVNN